ncbi:hypothetical protein [Haloferax larsenii]|nr:hypothetical protein [Haloferax larsenii]
MKTLAGLGVGTAALPYVSQEAAAEIQERDEIVRVSAMVNTDSVLGEKSDIGVAPSSIPRSRVDPGPSRMEANVEDRLNGRKAVLKPIPYQKWKIVESTRDAREKIQDSIPESWTEGCEYITIRVATQLESSVSSRSDPGSRYIAPTYPVYKKETKEGDVEEITPNVSYDEFQEWFPRTTEGTAGKGTPLEATVEGIPVRPEKEEIELQVSYDYSYRPVPAGCVFGTGADNSATLGVRADDYNNNQDVILTAAHTFKDIIGWSREVHQPVWINDNDQYKIGETDASRRVNKNNFDAVVVQNLSENTTRRFAADDGPNTYREDNPVRGILTNSEIDDQAGNQNFELTKQGVKTGRTSGFISSWDGSILAYRAYSKRGDSGCPVFHEYGSDYTYSLIAGIHKGKARDAQATSIENIEDRFNVNVGV